MNYPPYCPNKDCENHQFDHPYRTKWYWKKGHYHSAAAGSPRRFQCKKCKTIFSMRTFSIDYFTKKKINYKRILLFLVSCSSIRAMARALNCNTETIQNRIRRLSRNMMAASQLLTENITPHEKGTFAADGLESFISSQFFPTNINILVGKYSQFVYDFSYFVFHRKGRTTEEQKKKMKALYQEVHFEQGGATRSFMEILDSFSRIMTKDLSRSYILDTDENKIYRNCMKSHESIRFFMSKKKIRHRLTHSKEERNFQNKLYAVNYIDREVRKDMAEHVRETERFGRNSNNAMERFGIYMFWHNFMKPFRINKKKRKYRTHGEAAGCDQKSIEKMLNSVFSMIIPYSFVEKKISVFMKSIWEHRVHTPDGLNRQEVPQFLIA